MARMLRRPPVYTAGPFYGVGPPPLDLSQMPPPMVPSAARVNAGAPTWEEYFIYSADFVGAAQLPAGIANADPAGTALSFVDFPIKIDSDSDFKWLKTMYVFTDERVFTRIQDDTSGRRLHRSTMDMRAVAGTSRSTGALSETTSFLPFLEADPYVVAAASVLTISAADFSGAPNTVRVSLHGTKLRPGWAPWTRTSDGTRREWRVRMPFKIVLPPDGTSGSITGGTTAIFNAPIDIEADYIVRRITAIHTGSATIMVQDGSGRDRRWMDRAVDIGLFAGNGLFPNYLPAPRYVYRGSSIAATVQDTSGVTNRVRIYISGDKLYEK